MLCNWWHVLCNWWPWHVLCNWCTTIYRSVTQVTASVLLFQQAKLGVSLMVNISKLAERKKKQTGTKNTIAYDTLCVKRSSQSVHSTRRYCIVNVPYQSRQKRGEATCRLKIDPLNYRKCPTKHICRASSLSEEFTEPILGAKFVFFVGLTCTDTNCTGHDLFKMGVCVLANFSKTAERNKTPFTGIQVRLTLSSNQQTDQKTVHSTRRYSNIKVPYPMTK